MVEKTATLSTGTLNLRFMQNARRAQQLSGAELEKAHVKDDAEWEVAPEIRKAWGLVAAGGFISDSNDDLYERSYIPFLFPSVSESESPVEEGGGPLHGVTQPRGRRKFNKHGEESSKPAEVQPAVVEVQPDQTRKTKIKSISSMATAVPKASKLKEPASRVIYDNSNVGVDLRSSSTDHKPPAAMSTSSAFMKPAGVDNPSSQSSRAATAGSTTSSARKGKRRQDNTESETTRPKKNKLSFVE